MEKTLEWLTLAREGDGVQFGAFHRNLAKFNRARLEPTIPGYDAKEHLQIESQVAVAEFSYVEMALANIEPLADSIPTDPTSFVEWFEDLKNRGPGQGDPLFPWLEHFATREQIRWFIEQEVAGEAGFEDLLALTQVKMPIRAKLEMARNYWDELGRGSQAGMHGQMLAKLASFFEVDPSPSRVIPESLALGNMMLALARSRAFAFHSVGALGVIELTAPGRAAHVEKALRRLRIPAGKRMYFALHAVLDVKHSQAWNREVLFSLVEEDPSRAQAIGEGALLRLSHGARCFERYRERMFAASSSNPSAH